MARIWRLWSLLSEEFQAAFKVRIQGRLVCHYNKFKIDKWRFTWQWYILEAYLCNVYNIKIAATFFFYFGKEKARVVKLSLVNFESLSWKRRKKLYFRFSESVSCHKRQIRNQYRFWSYTVGHWALHICKFLKHHSCWSNHFLFVLFQSAALIVFKLIGVSQKIWIRPNNLSRSSRQLGFDLGGHFQGHLQGHLEINFSFLNRNSHCWLLNLKERTILRPSRILDD